MSTPRMKTDTRAGELNYRPGREPRYRSNHVCLCSLALLASLIGTGIRAQEDVTIRFTEEPYQEVFAFLGIYFETLGSQEVRQGSTVLTNADQLGMGVRLMSARRIDVQFESSVG